MPFSLSKFSKSLKTAFSQLETSQAEALSIEIAANYIAGRTAGEKNNSFNTAAQKTAAYHPASCSTAGNLTAASQDEPAEEDELTTEEKAEIALLVAIALGYLHEYNKTAQAQILTTTKEIIKQAGGKVTEETKKEIKKRLNDVLEGRENVVIDNVGKTKKELYVDKDLKLSEVDKTISKPFFASVLAYTSMLGENAAHTAYEKGKEMYYRGQGLDQWVFSGPADERARPHHIILIGEVFTWGSEQSSYAEKILHEPRCRHRAVPFYNDERDVKKEVWDKLKEESGVFWNDELNKWDIK